MIPDQEEHFRLTGKENRHNKIVWNKRKWKKKKSEL